MFCCVTGNFRNSFSASMSLKYFLISFYISGDPKYGIPILDPLVEQMFSMTYAGFTLASNNFTLQGLKDAVLEDAR
jgi:hypothetical protein